MQVIPGNQESLGYCKGYPVCAHARTVSGVFSVDVNTFLKYCVHKICSLEYSDNPSNQMTEDGNVAGSKGSG